MNPGKRIRRVGIAMPGLAVCLIAMLVACGSNPYSGGHTFVGDWNFDRGVTVNAYPIISGEPQATQAVGRAPLTVGAAPGAAVGSEKDIDERNSPFMRKYEVNFGDGSGWQDVTEQHERLKWSGGFDYYPDDGIDPDATVQHTYTAPGTYQVDARVTYWDGEVLYASQTGWAATVVVTPP